MRIAVPILKDVDDEMQKVLCIFEAEYNAEDKVIAFALSREDLEYIFWIDFVDQSLEYENKLECVCRITSANWLRFQSVTFEGKDVFESDDLPGSYMYFKVEEEL